VGKNFDIEMQKTRASGGCGCGPALDVDGLLPLVRYNKVKKPQKKNPRRSRRRNGGTLEKIDIEETIKINPV
jgi:hypothetical protein